MATDINGAASPAVQPIPSWPELISHCHRMLGLCAWPAHQAGHMPEYVCVYKAHLWAQQAGGMSMPYHLNTVAQHLFTDSLASLLR